MKARKSPKIEKMPTANGYGERIEINQMAENSREEGMQELENSNMVKRHVATAPIAGSTDWRKRLNKRGNLVETKMSKQLRKKGL